MLTIKCLTNLWQKEQVFEVKLCKVQVLLKKKKMESHAQTTREEKCYATLPESCPGGLALSAGPGIKIAVISESYGLLTGPRTWPIVSSHWRIFSEPKVTYEKR